MIGILTLGRLWDKSILDIAWVVEWGTMLCIKA